MDDEEDDSHYCLKCRRTIFGLDNYVKHRREGCRSSSPLISANDFFLSLNLISNQPEEDVLCSSLYDSHQGNKKLNLLSFLKDADDVEIGGMSEELPSLMDAEDQLEQLFPLLSSHSVDQCPSCKANVQSHQIGKHLISHYHHHHQRKRTDNDALVLKYITDIVKEAPYQCQSCSFYCNWHKEFLLHWKTSHGPSENVLGKYVHYWCSFCRFRAQSSYVMLNHLDSKNHLEIVAVINRSVPIVIRKIILIPCDHCDEAFRLRISYKKHLFHYHPSETLENKKVEECEFCSDLFFSSDEYKDHVLNVHSTLCSQCALCGLRFPRSQDLGVHVRNKACKYTDEALSNVKKGNFKCEDCSHFNCDTMAMLYFHRALKHSTNSDPFRANCPLCNKTFPKTKLWQHLKVHDPDTSRCNECYRLFLTAEELRQHIKTSHLSTKGDFVCSECPYSNKKRLLRDLHFKRNHSSYKSNKITTIGYMNQDNMCSICNATFATSSELKSHFLIHSSNKPLICSDCGTFRAKRISEINRHKRLKHGNLNTLQSCSRCNYSTLSSQHLKRHIMTAHTIEKNLFQCRFCSFKCATIENLRKHILKTKIHSDQTHVYNCDYCEEFRDNSAFQYGKHLLSIHNKYDYKINVKNYFFKDRMESSSMH
ncbi:uncharacterized protein [Lepeophtheirus salmonis]|uniref:uncharacterized protein n=1 Tax=Lepeophtheirus salmonis TaxID=72036 RepID=UPI001AEA4287|nr:zinc finger protein 99-like [Lepeophtheirus salmonis]